MRRGLAHWLGNLAVLGTVLAAPPTITPAESSPSTQTDTTLLTDASYCTACGPIACYVALRAMGDNASLAEVVSRCQWKEGEYTTIKRMASVIAGRSGVRCLPVRLSPVQLNDFLAQRERAAILLTRTFGPEVDHAVCALGSDKDFVFSVDYPQLGQWRHCDDLADVWDGEALIVWRDGRRQSIVQLCMALLPGASLGVFASIWTTARGRQRQLRVTLRPACARDKENDKP